MMYLTWHQTESLLIWVVLSVFLNLGSGKIFTAFIKKTLIYLQLKVKLPILKLINLKIFAVIINTGKNPLRRDWVLYNIVITYYKNLLRRTITSNKTYTLDRLIAMGMHRKINIKFLKRSSKELLNVVIVNKPIVKSIVNISMVSKMVIRKSRWFTKTKYSSIRQECKNIVHLTLFMNISFIVIIFNVYMHWNFLPGFPLSILIIFIIYSAPILWRLNLLTEFYTQLIK